MRNRCLIAIVGFALAELAGHALAFSTNITPGSRTLFLQVGQGSFSGTLNKGGSPENNATINVVSVSVPVAAVGNGTAQAMTSNSTQNTSYWDGYSFCNPPNEVYIGGYYQAPGLTGTGTLTATSPATLSGSNGGSIPFSQISWTSSGNGDSGAQPIPAGTFTGGTQTLATFGINTWNESCHKFSYANTVIPAAGTFSGRVTYTLSAP